MESLIVTALEIPEILYVAICIFDGRYGNGTNRIENLKKLGYSETDIKKIQECVNTIAPYFNN